jgi:predicted Zn-ribbon and HTH transcriptional regulator
MIDTSFIRSVVEGMKKQRQRPEEGTDELTQEYKKLTPGQTNEDTDKDEPGTQGDQAEYQKKRKEIANKFGVESCSALKDEKERKACYAALDAAHVSDDEEEDEDDDPVGKNEEVEYDEKKMKALAKKDKLIGKMMKTTSAKTVFNSEVLGNSSMEKAYQKEAVDEAKQGHALVVDGKVVARGSKSELLKKAKKDGVKLDPKGNQNFLTYTGKEVGDSWKEEVEVDESTAEYAKSLEKIANDRALKMLSKSERGNLKKIAALLDKEKKEEVEIEEGKPSRKLAQRDVGMECQECGKKFRSKLSTLQYGKTKCPKCKSTDIDFSYGESVEEEVELDEMNWAVGGVYHQEFKNGDKVYFRADSVQKNKRWKGLSVDEFGGRQKKAKNASADEKQQGWVTTPKNEIPKGLKEEVEVEEGAKFSASQLDTLKTEYSKLQKINPESPAYKKMKAALGKMSKEQLKQIKDAKIKFMQFTASELLRKMGEEVEIDEGVSEKDYDSLKKGDTVTIEYKGAMSSGKLSFKVTAKNIVGKAKVGKVTLQSTKNPKGVKHFLYKRGDKVSFAQGDMAASVVKYTIEEVDLDEKKSGTGYQLYHKDFSSAMQHAYVHAKKKGFIVDPKEIDDKVATGPKKPSSGKTNRYILGTDKKKNVHIQVANLDNKRYELNMYIESKNDHLGKVKNILERINLNEVGLDERGVETPDEWEKRTGKKPTKQTFDKAQADKKKDAFLKAYQGSKERETKKQVSRKYVSKKGGGSTTKDTAWDSPDYVSMKDIKKFPRSLSSGLGKIVSGAKLQDEKIKLAHHGMIPGMGVTFPGDSVPKLLIEYKVHIFLTGPEPGKVYTDPRYSEPGVDTANYKHWMIVYINEAATGNAALKGKVDWYQRKEFNGKTADEAAKRTLQYLKTKVKRMAKEEIQQEGQAPGVDAHNKVAKQISKDRAVKKKRDHDYEMKWGKKKDTKSVHDKHNEEVVVEREMTDSEKDKREEIVLSLKKKEKEFKERYGDKWKEVMYATATKMAMGEEEDPKSKKKDKINLKPKMDENMKTLKDIRNQMQEHCGECGLVGTEKKIKKEEVKEAITDMGAEVGEQDWDGPHRPENAYPNLNVNFAKFMEEDLEGPYMFEGENYFFDRKMGSWYSVSGEDYVDEDLNKVLSHNYVKTELVKQ